MALSKAQSKTQSKVCIATSQQDGGMAFSNETEGDSILMAIHDGEEKPDLLEYRRINLIRYIVDDPEFSKGNVRGAMENAFDKMDKELLSIDESVTECDMWETRRRSLVVILQGGRKLFVGGNSYANVFLARDGQEFDVTSRSLSYAVNLAKLIRDGIYWRTPEDPKLSFFTEVDIETSDEYLFVVAQCDWFVTVNLPQVEIPHTYTCILARGAEKYGLQESCEALSKKLKRNAIVMGLKFRGHKRKLEHATHDWCCRHPVVSPIILELGEDFLNAYDNGFRFTVSAQV